jgi:cell fate regulator YaaT (PSP1 superfamily)
MKVDLKEKEDMKNLIQNPIKIAFEVKRLVCYMDFEAQAI